MAINSETTIERNEEASHSLSAQEPSWIVEIEIILVSMFDTIQCQCLTLDRQPFLILN
jgi:hypothetical protein